MQPERLVPGVKTLRIGGVFDGQDATSRVKGIGKRQEHTWVLIVDQPRRLR